MVAAVHATPLTNPVERRRLARDRLLRLARLMDAVVEVPLLRTTVGIDALLGVVPVAGDIVSAAIGLYTVSLARDLGASRWLRARMVGNLLADALIGVTPVVGDVAVSPTLTLTASASPAAPPLPPSEKLRSMVGDVVSVNGIAAETPSAVPSPPVPPPPPTDCARMECEPAP